MGSCEREEKNMQGVRWAGWVTGAVMVAVGAFWMFMWLIGSNGMIGSRGTTVLGGNLLLVALAIPGTVWLTRRLGSRWLARGWSNAKAAWLATVASLAAGLAFLVAGCFAVLAVAGV
jgi:hypothetical protein